MQYFRKIRMQYFRKIAVKLIENAKLKISSGGSYGLADTHIDKLNKDLLTFIKD